MSSREKNLLSLLIVAGFLILNFLGFNYYQKESKALSAKHDAAERELATARLIQTSRQEVLDEMEWLTRYEPEPIASQDAEVKLVEYAESKARLFGLTLLKRTPLTSDTTESNHFHRARVEMKVSGSEKALYKWFDALNNPRELRITTSITINPNPKENTQIDCTATIEQWFVPLPPSA